VTRSLLLLALACAACSNPKAPTQAPRALTSRARGEGAIAIDADNVYWIDRGTEVPDPAQKGGKVSRVPKAGGLPKELTGNLGWPKGLVMDADALYWAGFVEGKIFKLDKRGATLTVLTEGQTSPRDLAIDATDVFFVTTPGEVKRVPKSGGPAVTLAHDQRRVTHIAVDGEHVFWLSGAVDGQTEGEVTRASKDGSHPVALAHGIREPGALAIDDTDVYWIDRAQGLVQRIGKDGGTVRALAKEQWNANQLALDEGWVWWQVGERILRVRKTGGAPILWVKAAFTVGGMAADANTLYFLENDGAVRSIPKQ
jgi:hypothetical protein